MKKELKKNTDDFTGFYTEENISVLDILSFLSNQIKVLIIVPVLFCFLMIFYLQFISNSEYTSSSKIISSSSSPKSQALGLAAQFGINLSGTSNENKWLYLDLINSKDIAKSLINRKFDSKKFGPQQVLLGILTENHSGSNLDRRKLESRALENFHENLLKVSEDVKTSIFSVSISTFEPELARDINLALIEELNFHQKKLNKKKADETRAFIEGRINDTEKELVKAEESLKNFKDRNRRIENSPLLQLEQQRIAREVTVLTGVFTTLKQQLETTKIEQVKDSEYVVVLDSPQVPLYRSKPKKKIMVIITFLFGIFFGVLIGLILEYSKRIDKNQKQSLKKIKSTLVKNVKEVYRF